MSPPQNGEKEARLVFITHRNIDKERILGRVRVSEIDIKLFRCHE